MHSYHMRLNVFVFKHIILFRRIYSLVFCLQKQKSKYLKEAFLYIF